MKIKKVKTDRTYDSEGFIRRAACLCVRGTDHDTEILLVSSKSSPDRFIVPGGGVEPEEDAPTAAIREVMEEAGVLGKLGQSLGIFETIRPNHRAHRTHVFIFQVEELLDEWDDSILRGRKRKWFSLQDALTELTLSKPVQCVYVHNFSAHLDLPRKIRRHV